MSEAYRGIRHRTRGMPQNLPPGTLAGFYDASVGEDDPDLARLESLLGHRFRDPGLLRAALTHASTRGENNERLEFLGDAVLSLVVSEALFRILPGQREGRLTELKSLLVARATLERAAERLGIAPFLKLGRGLQRSPLPASVLGNALEALLGAVYLDSPPEVRLRRASFVALRWLHPEMKRLREDFAASRAKQSLQVWCQQNLGSLPKYSLLDTRDPSHSPQFRVAVSFGDSRVEGDWANSKKEAERSAAWAAIQALPKNASRAGPDSDGTDLNA